MQDQSLIPSLLLHMVQGREEQRLKAAMELWNIASHQGNSGPSAVPVSEFLFEMLEEQPPPVQVEILDTLYQFWIRFLRKHWGEGSAELWAVFVKALPLLERLSKSSDEDLADFSGVIVSDIRDGEHPNPEPGAPPAGGRPPSVR
jgi:hypothetical protein